MISVDLLTVARRVVMYEIYTGSGDVYWTDSTHFDCTVPAGKRWFLVAGVMNRDASQAASVKIYNAGDELVHTIDSQGAATGVSGFPNTIANAGNYGGSRPVPMDQGDYLQIFFAGAQSTAAYATVVVLEIDIK